MVAVIMLAYLLIEGRPGRESQPLGPTDGGRRRVTGDVEGMGEASGVEQQIEAFAARIERSRARLGSTNRLRDAELRLGRVSDAFGTVTAGLDTSDVLLLSNLVIRGQREWIARHQALEDFEIRQLEKKDMESNPDLSIGGSRFRDLLQECGAPEDRLDYLHRHIMEVAANAKAAFEPFDFQQPAEQGPDERRIYQAHIEADRAAKEMARDAYIRLEVIALDGDVLDSQVFLEKALTLDPPESIPGPGY
jgi:hypothetical protein